VKGHDGARRQLRRLRRVVRRQGHAMALLGLFAAIAVFLLLFVELVRADQIAIATNREIARIEARWNRLQLQVIGVNDRAAREQFLEEFRDWLMRELDASRLITLASADAEVGRIIARLRSDTAALTPNAVARSAADPFEPDTIDRHLQALAGWLGEFSRGQSRAFRILLTLYGAVLLGTVGVAMVFAHELWSSEQQGRESRLLAQRFIRIREDERMRIAAELHDDAAQSVASAALIASRLREDFGEHAALDRLQAALRSSLATIKGLSRDLGVTGLQDVPIDRALDQLLADHSESLEATSSYEGLNGTELSPERKLHLYRIVQECITNTLKHAQATHIRLRMTISYPNLVLRYADNGIGFQAQRFDGEEIHLGLRSIRERARMVGGELAVQSKPGRGTRVTLVMPVDV